MLSSLTRNWWTFLLQGLFAIIFGALVLIWPASALIALVYLFGAFAMLDGICAVAAGITFHSYMPNWWVALVQGLFGILVGFTTLLWPQITWIVLLAFIAAWAMVSGVLEVVLGIEARKAINGEWMMIAGGILSILLGVLLLVFPAAGSMGLVVTIGIFAIVDGIRSVVFSARLQTLHHGFVQAHV